MSNPDERPLFKTGSSLAVTLPRRWTRHFQLEAGDKVKIVIKPDNSLVIKAKKRKSIDLTKKKNGDTTIV
jgi:antitoxin component of MazEF toxin-antitoxin module